MDVLKKHGFDEDLEVNGVWKPLPEGEGVELLVARWQNMAFQTMMMEARAPHQDALRNGDVATQEKVKREVLIEVCAKTILLGWRGPLTYGGVPLEYSYENAKKVLALRGFREEVVILAMEDEAYRLKIEAEEAKNSIAP